MKQTLSQILTLLLALQFLFASTGIVAYHHYCRATDESRHQLLFEDICCDKHHQASQANAAQQSCCQLPTDKTSQNNDDCCSHSYQFLQLDFDSPAQQFISLELLVSLVLSLQFHDYLPRVQAAKRICFYHDTSPPPNTSKRFLRFQNFRL